MQVLGDLKYVITQVSQYIYIIYMSRTLSFTCHELSTLGVRIQVLGDLELLPDNVQRAASRAMRMSESESERVRE